MCFGALDFGFGDIDAETGPFAEGEVDEVVDLGLVFGDEVDAPKTGVVSNMKVPRAMGKDAYPVSE